VKGLDDFTIQFSEEAKAMMEADPECAEAVRDGLARLRQALCDVDAEDPEAVAEAMEKLGAVRVDVPPGGTQQ